MGDTRLSEVLGLMRQWRELILKAESERQGTHEQDHKEAKVSDLRGTSQSWRVVLNGMAIMAVQGGSA